ncbi:amino acid adenylation domain-containing protein [Falsiroseomonas sp. HW251]|uniref:amino acid adenylation domain-containing protein n=1 Tax=Falsiroseomonas sp. HW251 TaxID=3390998 RepID=UPI003D320717
MGPQGADNLTAMLLDAAARWPRRTALFVQGTAIAYDELFDRAARLSGAIAATAGPARRCAILGARSLTAFTGVLGALLARCAYVPLNPRHPPDRIAGVLRQAGAAVVVVDEAAMPAARALAEASPRQPLTLVMPDATAAPDWAARLPHRVLTRADLSAPGAPLAAAPSDAAYLLFTSGSTGEPKGVEVRHRNLVAYLRAAAARYAPGPEDRFSQFFELGFDLSAHDMFLCWTAGAALHCPPAEVLMAPRDFARRHELSFWFSVPSTASFMERLRLLRPGDFPALRWALFCGEALPTRLAHRFAEAAPNATVENLYGPTEATIAITAWRLPRDPAGLPGGLPDIAPIGEPLPGARAVVLGPDGREAAPGEAGELCLGGAQVTDGYLARPALTAERFAPPAVADAAGTRWYRTGDRARRDPVHGLVFLGRMDRQVKIAGHRIELQEIEAALRRATGSDLAAAIAWPVDADGLARGVVGFIPDGFATDEEVLAACRRILPPTALPSRLHRVAAWPVNDNGKTDLGRLRGMLEGH